MSRKTQEERGSCALLPRVTEERSGRITRTLIGETAAPSRHLIVSKQVARS